MLRKLSIFAAIIAAIVFAPAMAFASASLGQGGSGWLATGGLVLGIAALGATIQGAARAEDEKDEKDKGPDAEGDEPPEGAGLEPSGACASCGMGNDENAKFCDQCGASMASLPLDGDGDAPPSPSPGASAPVAAKRVSAEGSVAAILGATSESVPAVKGRAIDLRYVFDTAAGITGQNEPGAIVGAMLTYPGRLAAADKAEANKRVELAARAKMERFDYAKRLNALGLDAWPRSMIFEDKIGADDSRKVVLRPVIAKMDLPVLRGMVETYEGAARQKQKRRDPFQPSSSLAAAAALAADPRKPPKADVDAATVIAWGKAQPVFASIRKQTPSAITDEQIARQLASTMQPRGGVQ